MLDRLCLAAVLFACVGAPLAAGANAVPEIALQPIPDEVLHGCDGHRLAVGLRDRLAHGARYRLAANPENAGLTLEITNCTQRDQAQQSGAVTGGPIFGPAGKGMASGAQSEVAVGITPTRQMVLEARVGAAGRFLQVSASAKDRNLREALDSLRKALDHVLEEKGDWLLSTSP